MKARFVYSATRPNKLSNINELQFSTICKSNPLQSMWQYNSRQFTPARLELIAAKRRFS